MHVEWYGQSAFRLQEGDVTVAIDPFGDMGAAAARGIRFEYPPIAGLEADLLLVTHEHGDHNGVEVVGGDPVVLRSTAGRLDSPLGEVLAIASEHDAAAGTERGPNTLFAFTLGDVRVAHLGDLGQAALRDEQAAALGTVDLLFIPVGGGPTIGGAAAAEIALDLGAAWVVPMHYRTPKIGFLETEEEFDDAMPHVERVDSPSFDTGDLTRGARPLVVIPAAP
jgi:L-ascorbate metabolism protein UlaG (beta-lactamase superfamily)